jgi:hypothetical protein
MLQDGSGHFPFTRPLLPTVESRAKPFDRQAGGLRPLIPPSDTSGLRVSQPVPIPARALTRSTGESSSTSLVPARMTTISGAGRSNQPGSDRPSGRNHHRSPRRRATVACSQKVDGTAHGWSPLAVNRVAHEDDRGLQTFSTAKGTYFQVGIDSSGTGLKTGFRSLCMFLISNTRRDPHRTVGKSGGPFH